jgi:hypothetical protein
MHLLSANAFADRIRCSLRWINIDLAYGPQTWSSGGKPVQRSSVGRWPVSLKRRTAGGWSGV